VATHTGETGPQDRALEHRQLLTDVTFSSATARCPLQLNSSDRRTTTSGSRPPWA